MNDSNSGITRTRLAREAGIGVETIRYYERIGLIKPPLKREHARPLHPPGVVRQLTFIKRAQDAGFTLKEIARLLELGTQHCSETKLLATRKLDAINSDIAALQRSADHLVAMIAECSEDNDGNCALFESLAHAPPCGCAARDRGAGKK